MNTTYFLNLVAHNVFQTASGNAIPSAYYVGLSSTAPTIAGGNVTEPSGGGYARVELNSSNLGDPSDGVVTNSVAIDFPQSTAAWGTMTHFVIYDAATGGNLLIYGELSKSRVVESDTLLSMGTGTLTLTVANPS